MDYSRIIFTKPMLMGMPSAWIEHIPFAFYLIDTLKPSLFVELGAFTGVSYFSFCEAIKQSGTNTKAYAVDHWKGDQQSGLMDESVFRLVEERNKAHFQDFSQLMRLSFDDAQPNFADKTIDLLHIDGYHTYEVVRHDFETWLPKMSDKGVVVFHDTQEKTGDFGVWRFFEELKTKYPACELLHGHGLGIVCTGEAVDQGFLHFVQNCDDDSFSQKLFASLGQLIKLEENLMLLMDENYMRPLIIARLYFGETSNSFTENNLVFSSITKLQNALIFKIITDKKIGWLEIHPSNDYAEMKLNDVGFYKDGLPLYPSFHLSSNAVTSDNDIFLFGTQNPQIYIDFPEPVEIDEIVLDIEFLKTGLRILKSVGEANQNLKLQNQLLVNKQTAYYDLFLPGEKGSDNPNADLDYKVNQLLILQNSRIVKLLVRIERGITKIFRKK